MEFQKILGLATEFSSLQGGEEGVELNGFLVAKDIPEEERYAVACDIAKWLAIYKFSVDGINDAILAQMGRRMS